MFSSGVPALHVVDGIEDERLRAGANISQRRSTSSRTCCGRPNGSVFLRIYASSPKDHARAISVFQTRRIHAGGRALHRVDDVKACLDKGFHELLYGAAGVLEDPPARVAVDPVVHSAGSAAGRVPGMSRLSRRKKSGVPKSVPQVKTASTVSPTAALILSRLPTAISHCPLEDCVKIVLAAACRHVPFRDVRGYRAGVSGNGAGTSAMSPNAVPGKPRITARPVLPAQSTAEQISRPDRLRRSE